MKQSFILPIDERGLFPAQRFADLMECIQSFKGQKVRIEVEKYKAKRSDAQNRYFWALCTILSKELGYTKDEVCEILKFKFLRRSKLDETTGELFEYLGSTSALNKLEFADFTTEVIQWAATLNIILPQPGEQLTINN